MPGCWYLVPPFSDGLTNLPTQCQSPKRRRDRDAEDHCHDRQHAPPYHHEAGDGRGNQNDGYNRRPWPEATDW